MELENELTFEQEMAAAYDKSADESTEEPKDGSEPEAVSGTEEAEEEHDLTEETTSEAQEQPQEPKEQSHEENAKYKAIRQKAEQEAEKKMQAALSREMDEFYRNQYAGKVNPETGKEILGKADAEAYETAVARAGKNEQAEQLRKELIDLGMSEAAANALVKPLTGETDGAEKQQAAQAKKEAELAEFSRRIDSEIEELNRRHPECGIRGPKDIGGDSALLEEIGQRADRSLVKAWESLHYEELIEKARAAARQTAINQARGGYHVNTPSGANTNGADVTITPEQMEVWKAMGYSEKDAVGYYLKQR